MISQHLNSGFAPDPWQLTETSFDPATNYLHETLFTLGNGYIGLRGTHEERPALPQGCSQNGSYINGFYETEAIRYPEAAYGLAKTNQFMLNVPDAKCIHVWLDDEYFDLTTGKILGYTRTLDFRTGCLHRTLCWESPAGWQIEVSSRRIVSFHRQHIFAIQYEVRSLNFKGVLRMESSIEGHTDNLQAGDDPRVGSVISGPSLNLQSAGFSDHYAALVHRTTHSGLTLMTAMRNEWQVSGVHVLEKFQTNSRIAQKLSVKIGPGDAVSLHKYGSYVSTRDVQEAALKPVTEQCLLDAVELGFEGLCQEQRDYLAQFWAQSALDIGGDDKLLQGLRFNQYHLLQSTGRDGRTNIAAKGLTGEGYEGHSFWDTEIYVLPFFLFNQPASARRLLEYRYRGLPQARQRAREMSHAQGALYPWRTIAGEECSAYFPAGTAQYHINADIAYAARLYWQATGDDEFLRTQGAEMVWETARIWPGIGHEQDGRFYINEVTGPDEYTALVNNNLYTNAMARMHLRFAVQIAERLERDYPADYLRITQAIGLTQPELDSWQRAANTMYLPYHDGLGIHMQDDSFLNKKRWDFAGTPPEKHPLLLHFHPLVIYRHQVCKQADVVLALMLLSSEFGTDDKRRDFNYYEAITTHDSSLSPCVFGIIAAEIGEPDKACSYFMETARLDLDNTHHNTQHGIHSAAMAGSWLGLVYGFGGMRVEEGALRFAPMLPPQWTHYSFRVQFRGALLQLRVRDGMAEYRLLSGPALDLLHNGQPLQLSQDAPCQQLPLERAK